MGATSKSRFLAMRNIALVLFVCIASICAAGFFGKGTAYAALQYGSVPNGYVKLVPAYNTNLALDIYNANTGNFSNASLYYRQDGHPNQVFYVQYRKSYRGIKFYSLKAVHSGRYLDVCGGSSSSGTNLHQYQWNGTASQLFCFIKNDNGNVIIKSMISDLVVDINQGILRSGVNVQLWRFNNSRAQQWKLLGWDYQNRPQIFGKPGSIRGGYTDVGYTRNATNITCRTINNKVTYYWWRSGNNFYVKAKGLKVGSSGLIVYAYNKTWGWVDGRINLSVTSSAGSSLRGYRL